MKLKLLSILTTLCMMLSFLPVTALAADLTEDTGGRYVISDASDLKSFCEMVNSGNDFQGKTVVLSENITLTEENWTPIGQGTRNGSGYTEDTTPFKGVFDGNHKTISGLTITETTGGEDYAVGLFGVVDGGTVKNLILSDVGIDVPKSEMAGGAIGMLTGGGTADNIAVSGSVSAKRGNGGIVGRMTISGTISNCVNNAEINGTGANVGGIVGAAYYTETGKRMYITDCENHGAVTGTNYAVGGIVGLSAADVSDCKNDAVIIGNGSDVAGIVAEQQNYGSVTGCINRGNIVNQTAGYGTGGIVGWIRYNGAAENYPVKEIVEILNNKNYGTVSGGNDAGGIIGTVYNAAVVTGNENYAETLSGKTFAAGIVGNLQFTEKPVNPEGITIPETKVTVTDNASTTTLDKITADCKGAYVYQNKVDENIVVENNFGAGVATAGSEEYATLKDALDAADPGEIVKLLKDVESTQIFNIANKDITLDLNGWTITSNLSKNRGDNPAISINEGSFTLIDSSAEKTGKLISDEYGIMAVNGGTVTVKSGTIESGMASLAGNNTTGDMNFIVEDGLLDSKKSEAIYMPGQAHLKVSGGTLNGGISARMGQIEISGGTINGMREDQAADPMEDYWDWGGSAWIGDAVYIWGGTYKSDNEQYGTTTNINITGGTINGNAHRAVAIYDIGSGKDSAYNQEININISDEAKISGEIIIDDTYGPNPKTAEVTAGIEITGGYFSNNPGEYLASGKMVVKNDKTDYLYMVVDAGKVGDAEVHPAPAAPTTPNVEKINADDQVKVADAIKQATSTGLDAAAGIAASDGSAVSDQDVADGLAKAQAELGVEQTGTAADIKMVIQPYMDITAKSYTATPEKKQLEVDILPKYNLLVVKDETPADGELITEGADQNAAVVSKNNPLPMAKDAQITISFQLPDGFISDDDMNYLFVVHTKGTTTETYEADVTKTGTGTTEDPFVYTATFTTNGFSPFMFTVDTRTASVQFTDKDGINLGEATPYEPDDVNKDLPTAEAPAGKSFIGWKFAGVDGTYKTLTDALLTKLAEAGNTVAATPVFHTPSSGIGGGSGNSRYAVTVDGDIENGSVIVSDKSASADDVIKITVKPDEGYMLDELTVADAEGSEVDLTKNSDSTYQFKMPSSDVTISAVFVKKAQEAMPFTDVAEKDWFYGDVKYVYENGLMNGTEKTSFTPAGTATRGMIVAILYRLENEPAVAGDCPFADVKAGSYYEDAITWAAANGITNGYSKSEYGPDNAITREQMAAFLYRYADYKGYDVTKKAELTKFADQGEISSYAADAIAWANANCLVNGVGDNLLNPKGNAERAQVAAMLHRFCDTYVK